jgi:Helicase associated domain
LLIALPSSHLLLTGYMVRFDHLKSYKEENGSCHVSRTVTDEDLKPLARWVKTQRALHKAGKILDDRKVRLESINFVWDGTQLPIKRKRRRQAEEGEKHENGQPAKIAKPEDAVTAKNDDGEDMNNVATTIPPNEAASKSASTVPADDPVTVVVDAVTDVDCSDMKSKAIDVTNEMESEDGTTELGVTNTVNAATDSAVSAAASDNQSPTETPTKGNTTVASETEENRGTAAGATRHEQNTELHLQLTNGNDENEVKAASQTIVDVMTQPSAALTTDGNDKPENEARFDKEDRHESAQATRDFTAGLEGYGIEGRTEETSAPTNAASPHREPPTRRKKRDQSFA